MLVRRQATENERSANAKKRAWLSRLLDKAVKA